MKKLLLLSVLTAFALMTKAQTSATIAIQFYVDANSNCAYNTGEQLVYNIPCTLVYQPTSGPTSSVSSNFTFTSCSGLTLYVPSPSVTPTNTLFINNSFGIVPNLSCGNYTNIPHNTNSTIYLPVTITGTSNLGTNVTAFNYYTGSQNFNFTNLTSNNNTIGVCSNIGNDSISMQFTIFNYLSCNNSNSISPRTYSLFLDGVNYDVLTTNGTFPSNTFTIGVNAMSKMQEYYYGNQTYLYLYPELPNTFTTLGSHTFQVISSMIYNNPQSVVSFSCILNSIPCTKISGKFYNDCNNNCTFDGLDSYGVGNFATGRVYNATTGFNLLFHPNGWDGKFSVYLPSAIAYSLTQYPTSTVSPYNFTACTSGTITVPPSTTMNNMLFGYKNSMPNYVDPGLSLWRTSSTSTVISPNVGATFGVQFYNNWYNICATSTLNPGKLKVTLPKFINYTGMVSGPTPTVAIGTNVDTLIWAVPNFSNTANWWTLNPFVNFSVVVSNTAVANTTFIINSSIYPTTDMNLNNNSYNFQRTVGGPFDPNGKYTEASGLLPNGDLPFGVKNFTYTIGFQNIGNAPAINVTTLDTIDVNFDLNTLEILQSSYPVSTQIDMGSRLVGFHFDGINLPGVAQNEPKSHGFVRYSIKLKTGVPSNAVLKNRAHNYFDFNEPVATNQTVNQFVISSGIDENGQRVSFMNVFPNPFTNKLKVQSLIDMKTIEVYDTQGKLLLHVIANQSETELDFTQLPPALYLIKVVSVSGEVSNVRVLKQ